MKVWQKTIRLLTSTTLYSFHKTERIDFIDIPGWGNSHMKRAGMLIKKLEFEFKKYS